MRRGKIISWLCACVWALCPAAVAQSTYVYVGNYGDNSVSGYAVNRVTGFVGPVPGSPLAAGTNPGYVTLDRQCRFAYVANQYSQNVSAYSLDTNTGSLTQIPGSPFRVSDVVPGYMAMDQLGKFLFVPTQGANGTGTSLSVFAVNGDSGELTSVAGSPFNTAGLDPNQAAVDPSNRFVYVTNRSSNTVSGFLLDANTGNLTAIPGSPWPTSGNRPIGVRADNTGRFLYVTNRSSIAIFSIDQTSGALTQLSGSPMPVGNDLYHIAIDVTNRYMYVADNFNAVYGYSLDGSTGALTPLTGFPITTDNPQGNAVFAIDPNGGLLYTSSFGGSNTLSTWGIDASTGALTPLGRVPTGSFPGSIAVCTADADGAVARLIGNNTYSGNQTVSGNIAATAFFGSGANLSGVVTGLTAGSGLVGGGSGGTVSLAVDSTVARTTTGNVFNGNQTVTGSMNAASFTGSGAGLTNVPGASISGTIADANLPTDVPRLGAANGFSNGQSINTSAFYALQANGGTYGVSAAGGNTGVQGTGAALGVYGNSTAAGGTGVFGVGNSYGVQGSGISAGVIGTTTTGIAGIFNATSGGKIVSGQNNGSEVFNVTSNGSVTIGAGTPILKHLSQMVSVSVSPISPKNCAPVKTINFAGVQDGDTVALGIKNSLNPGGALTFFAWVSSADIVSIKICNPVGPTNSAISDSVRVDVWKH